ncbi:NAD(P)/FAD-dependent oxidoreductase [Psychroflexus planctonicus]|uniref:Flavoprotein n=1 Tax=Psychroflexus planctonicus TaxID=1526575 RepID=A0ABQ1SGQ4_9FLAO|nr:NAD(P)/FAD-dependent oxidoreductase [Psychroflexus planctonicus]GGE37491.1 flavoprotein [Psychroflexus planctonicus]
MKDVLIIGGGAAGFFTAINCAQQNPNLNICILEKSKNLLSKVKVSGGGRCNVTHAEFDPTELAKNYPRGHKELRGPFHQFATGDMMAWLAEENVPLKIEEDGRIFPESDSSQTIIDLFLNACHKFNIEIKTQCGVEDFHLTEEKLWKVKTKNEAFLAKHLVFASGSSTKIWKLLAQKNYSIINPVPSLFTFNIKGALIQNLAGISWETAVEIVDEQKNISKKQLQNLQSSGPMLITHWGLSGPCILKLSAWGARSFHQLNYQFQLKVNWLPNLSEDEVTAQMLQQKNTHPKQQLAANPLFGFPKRLWHSFVNQSGISAESKWADLSKKEMRTLQNLLTKCIFSVNGKSTFKEEFVTAGGVDLKQINFKEFSSKLHPNLYFAGEVLNIDAVTGGFNFQNAWTGGYVIAKSIVTKKSENSPF